MVVDIDQRIVGGGIEARSDVGIVVQYVAAINRTKMVLEPQADARANMTFHDRHIDQIVKIDERIAYRQIGDWRVRRGIESNLFGCAEAEFGMFIGIGGVLNIRVGATSFETQRNHSLPVTVRYIENPDVLLRNANCQQSGNNRVDRVHQGVDLVVVVVAVGIVEIDLDADPLSWLIMRQEGSPCIGARRGARQAGDAFVHHGGNHTRVNTVAVPAG